MLLACGQIAEDPEPSAAKSGEGAPTSGPSTCFADPTCPPGGKEVPVDVVCDDSVVCKKVSMCGKTIQCEVLSATCDKVTECGPWGKKVASCDNALSCGALDDMCGGKFYCQIDAQCDGIPKGCSGLSDTTENVKLCSPNAVLCRRIEDCSGNAFCETKEKDTAACRAVPVCQGAEVAVAKAGDCSIAGTCVMRTLCGTSIWCSAPTR